MKTIAAIYGTRPEAIKMAPLVMALKADSRISVHTITTGQHREMLDQVNALFGIRPDQDLDISEPGQTLTGISTKAMTGLSAAFEANRPDGVIVQGDTTTALIGALTAFYHEIPVFHVEAGLRSGSLSSPFPEEANRKLISQIASRHYAPTEANRTLLRKEGISDADILVTGNTVIDALLHVAKMAGHFEDPRLQVVVDSEARIVLITSHRRENWGARLGDIATAITKLAHEFTTVTFVLPMHRNPSLRKILKEHLDGTPNVILTEALDYAQFARLLKRAYLVLTDSGGVQEEAPSLGKPVLVLRETTERDEGVIAGNVKLVGTDPARIIAETRNLMESPVAYRAMTKPANPYGDGTAAMRCAEDIIDYYLSHECTDGTLGLETD